MAVDENSVVRAHHLKAYDKRYGQMAKKLEAEIDSSKSQTDSARQAAESATTSAARADGITDGAQKALAEFKEQVNLIETAEQSRSEAEQSRKQAETARVSAEQGRETAFDSWTTEEVKRVSQETARVTAEVKRETDTKAAIANLNSEVAKASEATDKANASASKANAAATKAEADTKAAVDSASASVSKAVADAKADVDVAVQRADSATTKAETAVETANAANTAATQAVTDAQAAIAEVKATEAKLYPAAENVLVGSETGAVVHVDDAFAGAALRGITVEGAYKQDGTPSPDNPVPIQVIENPVVKVTGRNLANPSEAYYQNSKIKAEQIVDGFRFVITDNDTRILFIPCEVKKGETIVINFDEKKLSETVARLSIYLPELEAYLRKGNPYVVEGDVHIIGVYIDLGNVGEFEITNFRVTQNADDGYKPYHSQSLAFTLPAEHPYLAKLPDGTADEIMVDRDGNVELVARVQKLKVPDGGFTWNIQEQLGGFSLGYTSKVPGLSGIMTGSALMCDKLSGKRTWENNACFGFSDVLWVVPRTNQGDITPEDVAAVANGMVFYAPLATAVTHPLGKIEPPKVQDSIVNVWTDAEVTPNTGIEYTRDVNIVIANLESAIASITEG